MNIKKDSWVEKLVQNVNELPHLEVLSGYIGSGKSDDYIRIYHQENLSSYSEVAKVDIIHVEQRSSKDFPLGGSFVWLNRNAEIDRSSDRGKSSRKGKFLSSSGGGDNAIGWTELPMPTCNPDGCTNGDICKTVQTKCGETICKRTCDGQLTCNPNAIICPQGGGNRGYTDDTWYTCDNAFSCDCTTYDECTTGPVCKTVQTKCGETVCKRTCDGQVTCNPNAVMCPNSNRGYSDENWYTCNNAFSCDCTTYDECTTGPVCKTVRTHCGATICEETCSGLKTCNPDNIFCKPHKGMWNNTNHPYRRRNW